MGCGVLCAAPFSDDAAGVGDDCVDACPAPPVAGVEPGVLWLAAFVGDAAGTEADPAGAPDSPPLDACVG